MKHMVRKQISIQKYHEERLKRAAQALGISEAEIIRRALENELKCAGSRLSYDGDAMKRLHEAMLAQDKKPPVAQKKRDWMREELYEERMNRLERRSKGFDL